MMDLLKYSLVIIGSYFIGNISPSIMISVLLKKDIRKQGSGNPGTMNMVRTFGLAVGVLTLALDVLKGVIPALVGWLVIGSDGIGFGADRIGLYVGGLATIIGHMFPVIYKFKGGKGVASTLGILVVANPLFSIALIAIAAGYFFTVKIGSMTSFICIYSLIAIEGIRFFDIRYSIILFAIFLLTLLAHRSNIIKLLDGTERKMSFGSKKDKAKK